MLDAPPRMLESAPTGSSFTLARPPRMFSVPEVVSDHLLTAFAVSLSVPATDITMALPLFPRSVRPLAAVR
jgi:hypothetical protein